MSYSSHFSFSFWLTKLPKTKIGCVIFCTMFSICKARQARQKWKVIKNIFVRQPKQKRKMGWKAQKFFDKCTFKIDSKSEKRFWLHCVMCNTFLSSRQFNIKWSSWFLNPIVRISCLVDPLTGSGLNTEFFHRIQLFLKESNNSKSFYNVKYGSSIIMSKILSQILSDEYKKTGVSRKIVGFGILIHVLSWRQQNKKVERLW